ncbi:MAG TPA: helix-turn-helix transcriptional regulator [Solirubrobacterales bacterium]|nr:helix-turn-helix transcriptional regulator [Solirubrobacterales bacterium]
MNIAKLFGENLARLREAAGLSQEETGIRADLHRTEISQLERGLRVARIDTLVKLAGALGVEPSELLAGITWTPATVRPGRFERPDHADTL